jgi:hypothetical protein
MTSDEATICVIDALEASGISYMLVGSLSSNFYGFARSTKDADFVIELAGQPIRVITSRLGPEFQVDPQISFETITGTVRHVVNVGKNGFRVELFRLSDDAHDRERFTRRRRVELKQFQRHVFIPTVEDVIVTKLRWLRSKDRDDIRDVISVQASQLDWDYVYRWCGQHGTRAALEEIRQEVPQV